MRRYAHQLWTASLALCLWGVSAEAQGAEGLISYKVKAGDTCKRVARDLYDDPRFYTIIHLYNRKVCALPTALPPGLRLRLPHPDAVRRVRGRVDQLPPEQRPTPEPPEPKEVKPKVVKPAGPDAQITARRNTVEARAPFEERWTFARLGQDLWRAWRVNSEDDSSAEVTFNINSARLQVRENTLVIIYGPMTTRLRRQAASAELARGTLTMRLGELAGQPNAASIKTPTAQVDVEGGRAVVGVRQDGTTQVSNHTSKRVEVATRTGKKRRVRVKPGTGVLIKPNVTPEAPKPLPGTPVWTSTTPVRVLHLHGKSRVLASWSEAANAALYRFEVSRREDGREIIHAGLVPASVKQLEVQDIPPGTYYVHLAARTREGLESKPSTPLRVEVRPYTLEALATPTRSPDALRQAYLAQRQAGRGGPAAPEGPTTDGARAADNAPGKDAPPVAATEAPKPLPPITPGAWFKAPEGACTLDDDPTPFTERVFAQPGLHTLRCKDARGEALLPHELTVHPVQLYPLSFAEGVPVGLVQGRPREVAFGLSADAPELLVEAPPGVRVGAPTRHPDGYWTVQLTADKGADLSQPARLMVRHHGASAPLGALTLASQTIEAGQRRERFLPVFQGGPYVRGDVVGTLAPSGGDLERALRFGLRLGLPIGERFALELGADTAGIGLKADERASLRVFGYRLSGVFHLSTGDWRPFLRLGAGGDTFVANDTDATTLFNAFGGAGLKFQLDNNIFLRADLTQSYYPSGRGDDAAWTTSAGLGFMAEF